MMQEFKAFAMRGSVVDLAVGVAIGGAFGKIVTSFVNDVLMPPLGILLGGANFRNIAWTLKEAVMEGEKVLNPAVTINIGMFAQAVIDFLIIAAAIFMVVKVMNSLKKKEQDAPSAPPERSNEEILLTEIRDALRK
ncbi:MAG: large-conductance mechanosensitive channel protein MscL [Ignavibacteria bacterium]|nr:large-conductance mechanosensitive channel protein MscL [Ignavibacteria bacterium]